ncbi:MAG: glycosyltransferase, partial [Acidobacteriota bacterium]|nr:glycosyltransferase [Acidobacteriota bacterium]
LVHFIERGAIEGLNPSPLFDTSYYLRENPDVAALGLNPLAHYLDHGVEEGRTPRPHDTTLESSPVVRFVPPTGLLPWFNPLNLQIARSLEEAPSLNVLVPGLGMQHMSGGPNTALHIAYRLGIAGVRVRFISTDAPLGEREALWRHVQQLAGSEERLPHVEFVDGYDRRRPLAIGRNDVFFATAWWTAQMAKFGCDLTRTKRFIYLVQDYEPLFHPASTPQALALETYSLDYVPVVNSKVLFDYLTENRVGRFASPEFARQALIFEPAVDRSHFFMEPAAPDRPKRLLFYARPTTGLRNMYELGVAALMDTIARGVFDDQPWEMLAMGEAISPVDLGHGFTLNPAPWLDFARYAGQMRQSDILVSLMLSPHPSYPPLEMAACGGLVVTNTYDCKTSERLAQVSPNIIGADPTFESVAEAITTSVRRLADDAQRRLGSTLDLPPTWAASLAPVVDRLRPVLLGDLGVPTELAVGPDGRQLPSRVPCGFDRWPMNRYEVHRIDRLRERRRRGAIATQAGLFSFVTAVWNTDRAMLECLADSLLNQTNPAAFEWVILDNGSERKETLDVLERIRQHPVVRLHRSPTNLGIVRGLRQCIELAANRYVLFVDHDDFVSPDCVDVVAAFVEERGYPALFYTDEEKIAKHGYGNGYMKPDWDPVLFVNSCFIAHLCGVDRQLALELSCCDDPGSEGSHDWDTFMRFVLAGHVPQHLPETLYTWRAHEGSTAENIHSKPYVFASQQHVLRKFLKAQPQSAVFRLEKSPLFGDSPDWWIRRAEEDPQPITTVRWSSVERAPARQVIPVDPAIPHDIIEVAGQCDIAELRRVARDCSETGRLLHLMSAEVDLDGPEWAWEAMGLLALFPDAAMVGGRIHNGTRILTAGQMFGFEAGCGSPDRGRLLQDPGYFGQMWKPHSVSAVSCQHAVVHAKFLLDALDALEGVPMSLANLGAWLGGQARRARRRVVYSPFLSGRVYRDMEEDIPARERGYFRVVNADLIPESELWSPHLGLSRATAYLPVSEQTRRSEIEPQASDLLAYPEWLSARIVARKRHYALSASPPSLSVLTTVYSGTPARIFAATADSLARQSYPFSEWVILAHGAISRDLELALQQEEKAPNVRVLRRPDNLGIVGGMRECLLAAQGKYIVPVDADDLLTTDALQVIASAIERRSSRPVLVYSDEDVWCG